MIFPDLERRFGSLGEYLKYKEIGTVILQGKEIIFIGNGITVFILVQWLQFIAESLLMGSCCKLGTAS